MDCKEDNINSNRRDFLKKLGLGYIATAAALTGCDKSSNNENSASKEVPVGRMTYRINHNSGDKVSILGYGCMRWPTINSPEGEGKIIDQETVNELVDYAMAHGVNYYDTAPPYCQGMSEKATGIALKRHPRKSYYIATKLSNHRMAGQGWTPKKMFEESVKMYRNSFKELQTDYIDYYLLHIVGIGQGLASTMERFIDCKIVDFLVKEREAGRIRNLGFSYHGDIKSFDYLLSRHDDYHWDFVQIQLNYVDYRHASGINFNADYLYEELAKRDIPVVVMEPLLGGRLAGLTDYLNSRLKQRRPEDSIASWAFRFAGSFPKVLTVLSGMTYKEHLQDNIRTYSPLVECTEEEFALLEDTAQTILKYPSVPCTACQYCMPCPYGLDIPAIFSHYNKCINEGFITNSTQDENYAKARKAFLVGYDRKVPKLRQANHCIGCNHCVSHCPQTINIPAQMRRINDYVERLKADKHCG